MSKTIRTFQKQSFEILSLDQAVKLASSNTKIYSFYIFEQDIIRENRTFGIKMFPLSRPPYGTKAGTTIYGKKKNKIKRPINSFNI